MSHVPVAPEGMADCHFHVIAPPQEFPMFAGRSYAPAPAPLRRWRETLGPLGVRRGVVVQPSFYGCDNRVMLQALRQGGGTLVGIAAVDGDVTDEELDALVEAGVRGVRMAHFEDGDARALGGFVSFGAFDALEDRLRERSLHLQLFTDSRLLPGIAQRLRRARIPVVIDHMGRAPAALGWKHAGIEALTRLLSEGRVWVKLSGLANISDAAPTYDDAQQVHQALLAANPQQLIWGSDWPHTKPAGTPPDTAALLRTFHQWTPEQTRNRILSENPARLYRW